MTLGEATDEEGKTIPYLGIDYWSIKGRFFQPQRFERGRLPPWTATAETQPLVQETTKADSTPHT